MKLLQIAYGRLSDASYSCLCLSTKVIIVFKSRKIYSYIFIIKNSKNHTPIIKKQL